MVAVLSMEIVITASQNTSPHPLEWPDLIRLLRLSIFSLELLLPFKGLELLRQISIDGRRVLKITIKYRFHKGPFTYPSADSSTALQRVQAEEYKGIQRNTKEY
jgi:hypothetical protein